MITTKYETAWGLVKPLIQRAPLTGTLPSHRTMVTKLCTGKERDYPLLRSSVDWRTLVISGQDIFKATPEEIWSQFHTPVLLYWQVYHHYLSQRFYQFRILLHVDLTLPMLRLLLSKAQGHKDFWNPSKTCHAGICWIALAEYSQMSTHEPGFQPFLQFFASFCIGQISHHQHKG